MIIRRVPTDFVVTEHLAAGAIEGLEPSGASAVRSGGELAVYRLTKTSLTTPEAAGLFSQALARAMKAKGNTISWAGLKDKHAYTTQHVSVAFGRGPVKRESVAYELSGPNWSAELAGWCSEPLSAAAIERNDFEITIRSMSRPDCKLLDSRADSLRDPAGETAEGSTLVFTNYFGDQRFGSARHGQGFAGPFLVQGRFEEALKLLVATPARKDSGKRRLFTRVCAANWGNWKVILDSSPRCPDRAAIETIARMRTTKSGEDLFREGFTSLPNLVQTLAVEAFQSHLWNAVARALVSSLEGLYLLSAEDDFGAMVFAPTPHIPPAWQTLQVPMLSPSTKLEAPWGGLVAPVLKEAMGSEADVGLESLVIPGLRRPAFGDAMRPLLARATGFSMSDPGRDELGSQQHMCRTAVFSLARGAYATTLLRALGQ